MISERIRLIKSKYGFTSLILILTFIITSNAFNYEDAVANGFNDVKSYYFIATNGFTEDGAPNHFQHHLERWPIHVLVGSLSRVLDVNIWTIYRISVLILIFSSVFIIGSFGCNDYKKLAIFTFLLFNPYTFRPCYAAPAMISDCALLIGFLLFIGGIVNNNNAQIISGVLIAVVSKQTGILLIPIMISLYYFKYISIRNLVISCTVLIFGFIGIKFSTIQFYGEPSSSYFIKHVFGLFAWMFNNPSIIPANSFFGRYFLFLLTLSGFIILTDRDYKHVWLFIAIFLFIHSQPLAAGPLMGAGNIQRLSAHGLPFLIPLIVYSNLSKQSVIYFIFISILVSFHHNTTLLYNAQNGKIIFLVLVLISLPLSLYLRHRSIELD